MFSRTTTVKTEKISRRRYSTTHETEGIPALKPDLETGLGAAALTGPADGSYYHLQAEELEGTIYRRFERCGLSNESMGGHTPTTYGAQGSFFVGMGGLTPTTY